MGRIEFPFLLPPPFSSCYILVVDNKRANVSNYYDNNDDATNDSRSYFWRQTCESNNSPSALISRLRDASLNPEREIARFIIEYIYCVS